MKRIFLLFTALTLSALSARAAEVKASVYFPFEMADSGMAAAETLDRLAADMRKSGAKEVIVTGYCDSAEKKPDELSLARAMGVADQLRQRGVPAGCRFVVQGKGSADLALPTKPNVREPLNRRLTVAF